MTPGVLNALNRNRKRDVCNSCGFPLPIYPGRYPSKCPGCEEPRVVPQPPEKPDAEAA